MITQAELIARLDKFFDIGAFDESGDKQYYPPGYESVLRRFVSSDFLERGWNGLAISNTTNIDRVYCIVFPSQSVLDTVIAREVERGAPGALIFSHHLFDYQESGPGRVYVPEVQLEELREHHISYYVCHAPLDCHTEVSTASALADALKLKEQTRFAPYYGGLSGVQGKVGAVSFHDFARRVAEVMGLNVLRYHNIRHNGRPVQRVGIVAGAGGKPDYIREALELGCDTFVTGEWWLYGPGEWRAQRREQMHDFLQAADVNLIGSSHYASEAVVMRDSLLAWLRETIPAVDSMFVPQDDPYR